MEEERISDEVIAKYLQKERQEKKSNRRFVIGTIALITAVAVFTGGLKYAIAVGAILIVMIICAYFLTREFG